MVADLNQKIKTQNLLAQQKVKELTATQREQAKLKCQIETLTSKIDIASSISTYHDSCNYTRRIQELKTALEQSRQKGNNLEAYLSEQNIKFTTMYDQLKKEMLAKIAESNQTRCLQQIQEIVLQIKDKEDEIAEIQSEIDQIIRQKTEEIQDEELNQLKLTVQKKVTEHKLLLNDKGVLFEELYSKALLMINRDQQIIKNQGEIVELQHEIEINILEIEQKSAIIAELQNVLKQKKE